MMNGKPLDAQREERWPRTEQNSAGGKSLKVAREPWEVDSDYDDMEGLFVPYLGEPDPDSEPEVES